MLLAIRGILLRIPFEIHQSSISLEAASPHATRLIRCHWRARLAGERFSKFGKIHYDSIHAVLHRRVRIGLCDETQHLGSVVLAPALSVADEEALLGGKAVNGLRLLIESGYMGQVCHPCQLETAKVGYVLA